jgi:hypothetical protein
MSETAQSLLHRAATCWSRGDLYGADDALQALIITLGDPNPQTDLMTLQVALDLLEFDRAGAALDRLRQAGERDPRVAISGTRLLTWQGKQAEALTLLDAAQKAEPGHPGLLALRITHDRDLGDKVIDHANALANRLPDAAPEKTGLLFPLARYFDRQGDYQRSWALATEANTIAAQQARHALTTDQLKTLLTSRTKAALGRAKSLQAAPAHDQCHVYLIGAPRTGSSLLQSILSAHKDVDSSAERGALLPYLHQLTDNPDQAPPADHLQRLQAADLSGLQRAGRTAPTLIDKTTHNAFVAPLVAAIHPNSVFINVIRRPQDVALSMFLHEFPPAFPESTSLDGITTMLEARAEIMTLYGEAGFEVATVDFDAFCAAPEAGGKTLANLAGIDFNPATLSPENRNAAVPTFSAGQVRQPIRPTPPEKWQRFATFMPPALKQRLEALSSAV